MNPKGTLVRTLVIRGLALVFMMAVAPFGAADWKGHGLTPAEAASYDLEALLTVALQVQPGSCEAQVLWGARNNGPEFSPFSGIRGDLQVNSTATDLSFFVALAAGQESSQAFTITGLAAGATHEFVVTVLASDKNAANDVKVKFVSCPGSVKIEVTPETVQLGTAPQVNVTNNSQAAIAMTAKLFKPDASEVGLGDQTVAAGQQAAFGIGSGNIDQAGPYLVTIEVGSQLVASAGFEAKKSHGQLLGLVLEAAGSVALGSRFGAWGLVIGGVGAGLVLLLDPTVDVDLEVTYPPECSGPTFFELPTLDGLFQEGASLREKIDVSVDCTTNTPSPDIVRFRLIGTAEEGIGPPVEVSAETQLLPPPGGGDPGNGVGGFFASPDLDALPLDTADSSGPSGGVLAGIAAAVAAGVIALGGATWYGRRRRLR